MTIQEPSTLKVGMIRTFFLSLSLVAFVAFPSIEAMAQSIKMGPSKVKLVSSGKKPHVALRYKLKKDSQYRLSITMHMNMNMSIQMGKQKPIPRKVNIPPMELVSVAKVLSLSKQGEADIRVKLVNANPIKTPGMAPGMLKTLKRELNRMRGLSMRLLFSSRGLLLKSRIEYAPKTNRQFQQLMSNIQNTFRQIATPLPIKPVGMGAVWQVTNQLSHPIKLTQVTTFTLVKKQGSILRLGVKLTQNAKNQVRTLRTPKATVRLKMTISSKGQGNNTLKLDQLWIRSGLQVISNMLVDSLAPKNRQRVKTLMSIKTYVRSNPVKQKK